MSMTLARTIRMVGFQHQPRILIGWQHGLAVSWLHSTPVHRSTRDTRPKNLLQKHLKGKTKKELTRVFEVWNGITLKELAVVMQSDPDSVYEAFLVAGISDAVSSNKSPIDFRHFSAIASKLQCKFRIVPNPMKTALKVDVVPKSLDVHKQPYDPKDLVPKAPVVTLVGHVDHGKTTLLDYLRKSSIVECESGGITQHIGVFSVNLNGQKVTFLDTPGHAAFKTMRRRGTKITDIVVLLVDAVEGPLEQTFESLRAIRESRATFIVAISKIDRKGADIERVKQILHEEANVQLEDFGGDVPCVPISALKGENIDELIETILAQAEVLQLSADPKGPVEGTVVEANILPGLGKSTTALIRRGKLKKGQYLVCGTAYCKVKTLLNTTPALSNETMDKRELKSVGPAEGCKIFGWKDLPEVGGEILQVSDEKRAKEVVAWRKQQDLAIKQEIDAAAIKKKRAEDREKYVEHYVARLQAGLYKPLYGYNDFHVRSKEYIQSDTRPKVTVLVKTDFDGTKDAIANCLDTYESKEVVLDVIDVGVGDVNENDLQIASYFDGIIYTFNARVSDSMRKQASALGVTIKEFNIIYKMVDDLREELTFKMPAVEVDHQIGKGQVAEEFLINEKRKKIPVAGCKVTQGIFDKEKMFKVVRGTETIHRGELSSLKHFKDETGTIQMGKECGLMLKDPEVRFESGDAIICYEKRSESRSVEWDTGF